MGSQTIGSSTTETSGISTTTSGGGGSSSKSTTGSTYTVDEYVSGGSRRNPNLTIN